jgi:hypothetical protein
MIKRFDAPYEGMIEIESGEYVEYKDHESIVKDLEGKLLRAEWDRDYYMEKSGVRETKI